MPSEPPLKQQRPATCSKPTTAHPPASDYTYDARRLLADVAAGIGETTRIASEAHNLLSHLKLAEAPQ
jgi:hypothetical protein